MQASIIESIRESYQNLRHANHIKDFEETSKALHETMKQYDMLTRPATNNKTNSIDLAVLAFCILDEAYFKLVLSDTEDSPLSEREKDLEYSLAKARHLVKETVIDALDDDKFWILANAVSCVMKVY